MNLKRVELYGFKSFADKTVINFDESITGIVGPNGCGKSNIVDAVRWVLGEQSTAVLRCKKMSEVIFGGTTNRRSLSYCEVSLVLDNEQRFYPVEFDEVVITRKLYRSGDSEYQINKAPARLKDIIDLFRDSGIGKEGYSIIGQGKIDEILSTKPEARRQIFEDAAGITRHKAKRHETELKLERTRDNMVRLNDIVVEIERGLGPLQNEANNAAKGRELKRQLKMNEVSYFMYQCDHSAEERDKVSAKLNKTQRDCEEKQTQLDNYNREYNIAMLDDANSDNFIKAKREELTQLMVTAADKRGESRVLAGKLESLNVELANIDRDLVQYEGRLQDREEKKTSLAVEYNELNAGLAEQNSKYAELQKQYDDMSLDIDRQEREISKGSELILKKKDAVSEVKQNLVALEVERDMLTENIKGGKDEYATKAKNLEISVKERDELATKYKALCDEKTEKQKEQVSSDKNLADCEAELKDAETRSRGNELRIAQLKYKIEDAEEKKRDFTGYQDVVRRLMMDAESNRRVGELIVGTVAQKLNVPKDLQLAIEVGLGGVLQNIIVETREDGSELIQYLREKGYGRATFLPIEAVKANPLPYEAQRALDEDGVIGVASDLVSYDRRFAGIVSNIMGRMIIVEDNETGIRISRKYGNNFRMVTLDGTLFAQGGGMTGGSKPGKSNSLLSRETELDDLAKKLKTAEREQELIKSQLGDLTEERKNLSNACGVISARIHQLDVEIEAISIKLATAEKNVEYYQSEIERLRKFSDDGGRKIAELEQKIRDAKKVSDSLSSEGSSTDDFLSDARDKLVTDKVARDNLNMTLREAGSNLAKAQSDFENVKRAIENNKADIDFISQTLLDLRSSKSIKGKDLERTRAALEAISYDKDDQDKIDNAKAEIVELEKLKEQTRNNISVLDLKRMEANKALSELTEKRVREENALERIDSDIEAMASRIHEDYDMDYESAKAYCDGIKSDESFTFDVEKAQSESLNLRRKIERLGPLNELAEQRYEEEKARYDENRTQYNDLVAAEADLVKIIDELVTDMTEKFTQSFKQINENFQQVFTELFGGGSARLELEQSDGVSVLEAGIEINAAPPGKKPSRISLLSGGEKALTAIAILFAIIKLKPMPFSILDEIEAALDDSNVTLYANYLRKFSRQTQFIVITHRKPTMILADVLYGVMQQGELGVSQIVSVKLEEALEVVKEDLAKEAAKRD